MIKPMQSLPPEADALLGHLLHSLFHDHAMLSCQSAQCLCCFTFIKHTKCKSPTQHKATSSQTCVVRKCQLFTQVITKAMILCKYSRWYLFHPSTICLCALTKNTFSNCNGDSIWVIGRIGIGDAMQEAQTHRGR